MRNWQLLTNRGLAFQFYDQMDAASDLPYKDNNNSRRSSQKVWTVNVIQDEESGLKANILRPKIEDTISTFSDEQDCCGKFLKQALFSHENPKKFFNSRCQGGKAKPNPYYILWKSIIVIYFLTVLVYELQDNAKTREHPERWFVFLTNLGYTFYTITLIVEWTVLIKAFCNKEETSEQINAHVKVSWFLIATFYALEVLISIFYWAFLHDFGDPKQTEPKELFYDMSFHLLPVRIPSLQICQKQKDRKLLAPFTIFNKSKSLL